MRYSSSDYEVVRDFALFQNTSPSDAQKQAWLKASPSFKRYASKKAIWTSLFVASLTALAWVADSLANHQSALNFFGALVVFGFAVLSTVCMLGYRADCKAVLGWAKPLKGDIDDCARFVGFVEGTKGRVVAKDRELCKADLIFAHMTANEEEYQKTLEVCAKAHSFVEVTP